MNKGAKMARYMIMCNVMDGGEASEEHGKYSAEHKSMKHAEDDNQYKHSGARMIAYTAEREIVLTPEMAQRWTKHMKNADGSTGEHWNMEQTEQLAKQRGISVDPVEFYVIVNAMYSDYCEVAKKHNIHNADFYADLAKAWLKDTDAVPDKAAMYYEYIVKNEK